MDAACQLSGSGPEMLIGMSSPRALKIESFSAAYLVDSLIQLSSQMFGHQRGQDADHHDVGPAGAGLGLGIVEAGAHFCLQVQTGVSGQRPGRHIEFDVVGA